MVQPTNTRSTSNPMPFSIKRIGAASNEVIKLASVDVARAPNLSSAVASPNAQVASESHPNPAEDVTASNPDAHSLLNPERVEEADSVLIDRLTDLWRKQNERAGTVRHNREELRAIRASLGAELSDLKSHLAKTGREGGWKPFLEKIGIPRSTADRHVDRHRRTVRPEGNCTTEAIGTSTPDEIAKYARLMAPKLLKKLGSPEHVREFLVQVRGIFD